MTHIPFLTALRALFDDRSGEVIYPCIHDLVENGLTLARFSSGNLIPSRQDVTQFLSAWCKHTGLTEEECRSWLIEYCTVMLSSISKTSVSGIRHSTKSNIKYVYRADIPFVCEFDDNPFRAHCSVNCRAFADMKVRLAERKNREPNTRYEIVRPAPVVEACTTPVKETYRAQFETGLQVIHSELEKGKDGKAIVELLNERGIKTRTGRKWTFGILWNEISKIKGRHDVQGNHPRQVTPRRATKSPNTGMGDEEGPTPPLLTNKNYDQPSVFVPENLLREARRQKGTLLGNVPAICILDPDGDIVRNLLTANQAKLNPYWACYHTQLYNFHIDNNEFGIIGCAVGASFAVLVAEELFASGCQLLISVTSSGQILPQGKPPFFVLIERALRDEGTSYHYLPPSDYSHLDDSLHKILEGAFAVSAIPVYRGAAWTTDAPFRETDAAVKYAQAQGIWAVEMEAAALYAFAQARQKPVVCFAHVTNQMGNVEGDFEKGEGDGSRDALRVISLTVKACFPPM